MNGFNQQRMSNVNTSSHGGEHEIEIGKVRPEKSTSIEKYSGSRAAGLNVTFVDPGDFEKGLSQYRIEDALTPNDPQFLHELVEVYSTGYKFGRYFLLTVLLVFQVVASPFLGMMFAGLDYAKAWIAIFFQVVGFAIGIPLRLVGQILEYFMDAVWGKRPDNDMKRYRLGLVKAQVAAGKFTEYDQLSLALSNVLKV